MRLGAALAAAVVSGAVAPGGVAAHDFRLLPSAFDVATTRDVVVRVQTGSRFAKSEAAVAVERGGGQGSDSAAVAATIDRFHQALAAGDSVAALALLTRDVTVLESGGVEDRAEYRSHHLQSDIEFARAVLRRRGPIHVRMHGNTAWASSTSTTEGTFRGRAINSAGAELMVLVREGTDWKIAAIHWSSRNRRAP
ncbi:MAG: nuclear transport factor 2 family protein [Gemmatimonadetes bacterium]|nr:nuclear transport factor 2 family protein [Gemmatimonadota bacterium]